MVKLFSRWSEPISIDWNTVKIASIILTLALAYPVSYFGKKSLPIDLLYWTFSTTAQAFVALGALFGMISVFKLQTTNNAIEVLSLKLKDLMVYFRGTSAFYYSSEDILREGKIIISEDHPASRDKVNMLKSVIPILEEKFAGLKMVRSKTIMFIKSVLEVVFFSLLFLASAPIICHYYLDLSSILVILTLSVFLIISTTRLISDIMEI